MDYIQDGGHGWFKVSIKQLIKLGIADRISSYSYWKGDYAYLEEDCDASTYVETLKENADTTRLGNTGDSITTRQYALQVKTLVGFAPRNRGFFISVLIFVRSVFANLMIVFYCFR